MENLLSDYWFELAVIGLLSAILVVLVYIAAMGSRKAGELSGWARRIHNEPVIVRTAIGSIVGILATFGLSVTEAQQGAIILGIVTIAGLVAGTTRSRVTPVS